MEWGEQSFVSPVFIKGIYFDSIEKVSFKESKFNSYPAFKLAPERFLGVS
jgi:hypothetical protein